VERALLKVVVAFVVGWCALPAAANPGFAGSGFVASSPESIVTEMSIERLVGQTMMIGYTGGNPSKELVSFMEEVGIGGIKVFGWNSGDLVELASGIALMQRISVAGEPGIPLFVATDQEGGWVRHVKGATSDTPGNLALGASRLPLDAYENGLLIGRELAVLGINMNFAPTVDVYLDPDSEVIGPRAFSADPVDTALLSLAFYRGLERAGVVATAKHFPGHGNTSADSHGTLPVISDTIATIWDRDLLPYRMLIAEGLPAVMSGHLSYPAITGVSIPATLSSVLLETLLRDRLGFDGIVMTDDMRMYGVLQDGIEVAEACRLALLAGNDMIMISQDFRTQQKTHAYLVAAARDDAALQRALKRAATNIIRLKKKYLDEIAEEQLVPVTGEIYNRLPDREGRAALFDLACRSVTVLRSRDVPMSGSVVEESGRGLLFVGKHPTFLSEGLRRFPNAETWALPGRTLSRSERDRLSSVAESADRIVFCLVDRDDLPVLQELAAYAPKVTVFSVLTPVHLLETPWVASAIATYGRSNDSFRAGFAVLSGDFVAEGIAPIRLDAPTK
jgi:beta-N-acetylhexosaminidase